MRSMNAVLLDWWSKCTAHVRVAIAFTFSIVFVSYFLFIEIH